jgi:hypothetical protein
MKLTLNAKGKQKIRLKVNDVINATGKAWLMDLEGIQVWVAKSQAIFEHRKDNNKQGTLTISQWYYNRLFKNDLIFDLPLPIYETFDHDLPITVIEKGLLSAFIGQRIRMFSDMVDPSDGDVVKTLTYIGVISDYKHLRCGTVLSNDHYIGNHYHFNYGTTPLDNFKKFSNYIANNFDPNEIITRLSVKLIRKL